MASDNIAFVNTEDSDLGAGVQSKAERKTEVLAVDPTVRELVVGVEGDGAGIGSQREILDGSSRYSPNTHSRTTHYESQNAKEKEALPNVALKFKLTDKSDSDTKELSTEVDIKSDAEKKSHQIENTENELIQKKSTNNDFAMDSKDTIQSHIENSKYSEEKSEKRNVSPDKSDRNTDYDVRKINGTSRLEKDHEAIAPCTNGTQAPGDNPSYAPGEERRMIRNVAMVGVVFMVHFTATLGATHLQSSVNAAQGLGTSALAAQYVGIVVSSLLLSVYLIERLGCKWTIAVAILANIPYMAAQLYTRVYTLVPGALLMGLGVAPLWSAKCTYLCVISEAHADFTGGDLKSIRDKVIGIFFMIFLFSIVWGNLISSVVLSAGEELQQSSNLTVDSGAVCGANFCPGSEEAASNPNLERPSEDKIRIIMGIYLACIVLACLIAAFGVDSLKRYKEGKRVSSGSGLSTLRLLTVTLELHKQRDMLLMVPLSLWLGVDYGFIEAEYTASFVACAWGISNIGYVIICYGLANSALALITGWLVARAGRRPVMCVAAVLHAALIVALLLWRPSADHKALFFVGAAVWGAVDGHWAVQINSLYAILFPGKEEAAYSNFRLWQSVGFIVAFSYSHHLCTAAKLYIVLGLLGAGVLGYLGIEYSRPRKMTVS